MGYAIRYRNSLKKLLLIGAVVSSAFYETAKASLKEIGSSEQIMFAEKLWNGLFDGSKEEIVAFYNLMSPLYMYSFKPGKPPLEIGYNVDLMNFGWGTFLKAFDYSNEISKVKCETLILYGENEWIMPRDHVDLVCRFIPNCSLKVYPECMHMLWIDQWDKFVHDALEFFLK